MTPSRSPSVAETLGSLPPDATRHERRAALERLARERNLPVFTTWEEWQAHFSDLEFDGASPGEELYEWLVAERARRREQP